MKLVDILARELKVWPEGYDNLQQSFAGMVFHGAKDGILPIARLDVAEDFRTAEVTRAEWQAAVDALKAPKIWSGEGLPPVGTVCDCKFSGQPDSHFTRVTIRYISDKHVVLFGEVETSHNVAACVFRPIRTPEQIAAEEREIAIADMKVVFDSCSDELMPTSNEYLNTLFGALYDAGYRKFEIVEGD